MAKQREVKASKHEQDDVQPRQPAWRERAPAKPRRRIKHKQATAPGDAGQDEPAVPQGAEAGSRCRHGRRGFSPAA